MDTFIVLFMMLVTIVGPSLIIGSIVLGIPIIVIARKSQGKAITLKVVTLCILSIVGPLIIAELLAVVALLGLFYLFGN